VYLHIGAPKTGTTYLQNILFTNRAALRRNGLLYPGNAVRSHFWASQDLREIAFHGHVEPQVSGAWNRLVDQIRGYGGPAVIDHEILAATSAAQIDRALADLDFADVHIIFTARDIARQLPAAWQERIKNRDTLGYRAFLDGVHAGLTGPGPKRYFWPLHDVPGILARWSRDLPPDRVHLVTLPHSGADPALLWQRFAGVLGIDPDGYDTDLSRENTSLTAAEAAVLRALNAELDGVDVPWPVYRSAVKHGLSGALGANPRTAARIELPTDVYEWVVQWTHDAVAELAKAGYHVVGDLDELIPAGRPTGADPDAVPAEDRVEAATRMLGAMLTLLAKDGPAQPARPGAGAAEKGGALARRMAGRLAPRRATSRRRRG
jgi:hypothetical protein